MRIQINDPDQMSSLLAFLRGHVHVVAEQLGPRDVEVSLLGSRNRAARRLELDLMLQVWRASHEQVTVAIVD